MVLLAVRSNLSIRDEAATGAVFDLTLPRPGTDDDGTKSCRFIGYGPAPGL